MKGTKRKVCPCGKSHALFFLIRAALCWIGICSDKLMKRNTRIGFPLKHSLLLPQSSKYLGIGRQAPGVESLLWPFISSVVLYEKSIRKQTEV